MAFVKKGIVLYNIKIQQLFKWYNLFKTLNTLFLNKRKILF